MWERRQLAEWFEQYMAELHAHVRAHGHARIGGSRYGGRDSSLVAGTEKVRRCKRQGRLSGDQVAWLEQQPGWCWSALEARWFNTLDEAIACVRQGWDQLPRNLAVWTSRQSQRYENKQLTAEQSQALEGSGLLERESSFDVYMQHVRQWLQTYGTLARLQFADMIGEYPIGRRTWYYTRRAHGLEGASPLPITQQKLLRSLPGWAEAFPMQPTNQPELFAAAQ